MKIRNAHWIVLAGMVLSPGAAFAQISVTISGPNMPPPPVITAGVSIAPPAPRAEVRPPQPGPGYVWVSGYWSWNGGQHVWTPGQWQAPPQQGAVWVAPRWEQQNGAWAMHRGEWRANPNPTSAPTQVAVAQPVQPMQPQGEVEVNVAPPAPRAEVRPPQPGPGYVWVGGYWNWNGGQHVWTPGQWQAPPQQGASWSAPQWEQHEGRWRFRRGEWRAGVNGGANGGEYNGPNPPMQPMTPPPPQQQQADVEVTVAPPAPRAEVRPPQPGPGYVWVGGYWNWTNGQHVWTPGQWQAPPQQGASWESPQWEQRQGRWHLRRGEWRFGANGQMNNGEPPREQAQPQPVQQVPPTVATEVNVAPPAIRRERRPPAPGPGMVWVAGYWNWNGTQYAWTPGQWQAPPQQGVAWAGPRWQRHGHVWVMEPGHWNPRAH